MASKNNPMLKISDVLRFADDSCNCDNSTCVKEVQKGTDVQVSEFGGEGTGMKSIKVVPWKDNEDVTMTLNGEISALSSIQCKEEGKMIE